MNLKIKMLSGVLAGGMLFSFVPSIAAENDLHDIQIVEEYISQISDVQDVWNAYFYLAGRYINCNYDTVGLTKMYNVLLDLKNKIQESNFEDLTLEGYMDALFFVHEACLREYCGLFEDAKTEWQTAFLRCTRGCICKASEPSIRLGFERIRSYCWERMYYCMQYRTSEEMCVVDKFLKPIIDLLEIEIRNEYQNEEISKIYTKFMGNSIPFLRDACKRFPTFIHSLFCKAEELNNKAQVLREKNDFIKAGKMQLLSNYIISSLNSIYTQY